MGWRKPETQIYTITAAIDIDFIISRVAKMLHIIQTQNFELTHTKIHSETNRHTRKWEDSANTYIEMDEEEKKTPKKT